MTIEWYEILIRLFLAIILGGAIGLERELHGHPAGLRTHVLVSVASALAMLVSKYGFVGYTGDPARLAAQVVSGIGFLGAGAIIHDRGDIKGITTAATLWVVAIVGLATGNGFYTGALGTTIMSIVVLIFLRHLEKYLGNKHDHVVIVCDAGLPVLETILNICASNNLEVKNIDASIIEYGQIKSLKFSADFNKNADKALVEKTILEITEKLHPFSIKIH